MSEKHPDTTSARTGERNRDAEWPRPETQPIYQTSVFAFDDVDDVVDYYASRPNGRYLYSRNGNPNVTTVEEIVARLEGAESACFAASGMGAISAAVLSVCKAGDHILVSQDIYGGTLVFLRNVLANFQVSLTLADFTDLERVDAALAQRPALLIAETLSNPLMRIPDIAGLAKRAHEVGAVLMVDNTFATPLGLKPLALGADLSVHSATKYMGGHSDVSGGVVCGNREWIDRIRGVVTAVGSNLAPFDAWLIARGIKTMPLRFERACANARLLAAYLSESPAISRVWHPSRPDHPEHDRAVSMMPDLCGAIVTIALPDSLEQVNRFMRAIPTIVFAPSLAGVTTTLSHPWTTSHRGFSEDERRAFGITEGLVRISVGIEQIDDLKSEFAEGLAVFVI